jgi:phenylalanine-4-hydroxylase
MPRTDNATTDLTTGISDFIKSNSLLEKPFIHQPYDLYSTENHRVWQLLFSRMEPLWEQFATTLFLDGLNRLPISRTSVPILGDVNTKLSELTGFQTRPVSGYIPAFTFFDCLRRKEFPTTVTIRPAANLDYLAEPDIFHDVAGHVPMHTHTEFTAILQKFGECAHIAIQLCSEMKNRTEACFRLKSIIRGLARAFWFTVEFGLMDTAEGLRAYGSGLLSSNAEIRHALMAPNVMRVPLQLEWVLHAHFDYNRFQCLLFVIRGFDELYAEVQKLEQWMKEGRLDNLSAGEPDISDAEVIRFMPV